MINEIIKEGLYYLTKVTTPSEVFDVWHLMREVTKNKCLIISLNDYNKNVYPKELIRVINSNDTHFIPYFESDRLYFIDDDLLLEMHNRRPYDFKFKLDYSVMLDTNYSSYIHKFVNNDWSDLRNEVFSTIDILIRQNFHFDYFFYMIENYKNSFCSSELDNIVSLKNKQINLYQNLVSLELFKSIDTEEYRDNGTIKYKITKQEAYLNVDGIFRDMFNSAKGKETMEMFLNMHKSMVLFLIGVIRIRFQSKTSLQNKIKELFEYIDKILGYYPEREMVIAHKYFLDSKNVKIINKINKGMKEETLYSSIENIAWDFTVPRILEFFLENEGEGRYFIPFFLSNDKNLRELLRLYRVKGVLYSKTEGKLIPISNPNSREYFNEYVNDIDSYFTNKAISMRKEKFEYNRTTKFEVIKGEFSRLVDVMECK